MTPRAVPPDGARAYGGRKLAYVAATVATSVVTVLILMPARLIPPPCVANQDKFEHLLVTATLGALWTTATRAPAVVMGCGIAYAIATELLQGAMAMGRTPDGVDAFVDAVGTALGCLAAVRWLAARSMGTVRGRSA